MTTDTPKQAASRHPYAWRTALRQNLPWFLINLGIARKGADCDTVGAAHAWYNVDESHSGCYHCRVVRAGRLWETASIGAPNQC